MIAWETLDIESRSLSDMLFPLRFEELLPLRLDPKAFLNAEEFALLFLLLDDEELAWLELELDACPFPLFED